MKRLLVISPDDAVVGRIRDIFADSSAEIDHADCWDAGRNRLINRQFSAAVIDSRLVDASQPRQFVQLNDILSKESTRALLISHDNAEHLSQYVDHLDSFDAPLEASLLSSGKGNQRIIDLVESARTLDTHHGGAGLEASTGSRTDDELTGPVEVDLPPLNAGELQETNLAEILQAAHIHQATGLLELTTNQITRRIALRDGDILDAVDHDVSSLEQIPPIFAWTNGDYTFENALLEGAGLTDVFEVIARGVFNHMDQRRVMNELMTLMDRYVAVVDRYNGQHEQTRWAEQLNPFMTASDGETTLESILSSIRSSSREEFQAAYLAIRTHRVVLADRPMLSPISVSYGGGPPEEQVGSEASSDTAAGLQESTHPSSAPDQKRPVCNPDELENLLERARETNAYELLGAWEGCGKEVVRNRFIPLVKRFHPDRFDQDLTEEQRETAQTLFMRIQEARETLVARESTQSKPEPAPPPTSALLEEVSDDFRNVNAPPQKDADASQPNTNTEDSGVIGLGGRSDVEDFARQMGHKDSSSAEDTSENTEHDSTSDDAIALGASSEESESDRATTEELSLGQDSSLTLETESAGESSEETSSASSSGTDTGLDLESAPSNPADPDTPSDDSGQTNGERDEKVKRLRHNTSTSTANLAAGSSTSVPEGGSTRPPSLGSPPTTDKQARNHFNYGYKALKAQNEDTALKHLKLAHDYDSENGLYKTFYGYALFQAHPDMRDEAEELLREAIATEHRQALPDAHLFLGRILRVKDEHAKAKHHFAQSLELNPDSKAAQRELRLYEIRDRKQQSDSDASDDQDDVSFKDDPAGYLKNLFNKDLF